MKRILPFLILSVGLSACSEVDKTASISEEDAQVIATNMASALADRNDGVMTELYDLTSALGFGAVLNTSGPFAPGMPPRPGAGNKRNFTRTYDPATGKHVISFEHSITANDITKSMSVYQEFIYKNPAGSFVQFPGRVEVATLDFTGRRQGTVTTPRHSSQDLRKATWSMSGLQSGSAGILLNGSQENSGDVTVKLADDKTASRQYTMKLTFADVNIAKSFRADSTLENKVSGTITFEHSMKHTLPNGELREKTNSGSIELTGNGRALLRIMGIRAIYGINLSTGDVDSGS
jgi:hypothetical protein